jgi:hypothetical protein
LKLRFAMVALSGSRPIARCFTFTKQQVKADETAQHVEPVASGKCAQCRWHGGPMLAQGGVERVIECRFVRSLVRAGALIVCGPIATARA